MFFVGIVTRHVIPNTPSPYAWHPVVTWRAQTEYTLMSEVVPVVLGVVDQHELDSVKVYRMGLPLVAAEALTVHKSVGLSLPAVCPTPTPPPPRPTITTTTHPPTSRFRCMLSSPVQLGTHALSLVP